MPWVNLKELVEQTGFAQRSLQYIRKQEPGVLVTRAGSKGVEYKQPDCSTNLFRREREIAKKELAPKKENDSRDRKEAAEAQEAELRVARLLDAVIDTTVHEDVVGQICERLRAVILNMSGNYGVRLEAAGIDETVARTVLDEIAQELTVALRGVADELDGELEDDTAAVVED